MRKILSLFIITTLFAGNLEVEGGIVATQGVTASSFVGDGSGLTNLPTSSLSSSMQLSRILYCYNSCGDVGQLTVPAGKIWAIVSST